MHTSTTDREKSAGVTLRRRHLWAELPENPVCWLRGHKGKVRILTFGSAGDVLIIECRVCGRRYRNPDAAHLVAKGEVDFKTLAATQLEFARSNPDAVAASASGRVGYDQTTLELGLETVRRPWRDGAWRRWSPGFRLHLGTTGSETPIDGHIDLGPVAAYWSIGGVGGRLAEKLGRGHKRNLGAQVHNGTLWWEVWYDDDGGYDDHHQCDPWRHPKVWPWSAGRKKYRPWMCLRHGHIDVNPIDAVYGRRSFTYRDLDTTNVIVNVGQFETDRYLVKLTLQEQTRARTHGPAWARGKPEPTTIVEWEVEDRTGGGIPFRNNSWKGDGSYASAVKLPAGTDPADWITAARDALVADTLAQRARHQYRAPEPTL